jgi:RND family efflux transporter MFP subunit
MSVTIRNDSGSQIKIPIGIGLGVVLIAIATGVLLFRSRSEINQVALSSTPRGVSTVEAQAAKYRPSRRYIGTIAPWLEARIGPQFTAAYVDTVLVRPGESAKKGQVLATLDCKSASAQSRAMQMQARALSATQEAISKEVGRMSGLLEGGFVSPNEVERKAADSASKQAELLAANARLVRASLEVDDCVLHAPFDGEIADRMLDPGGFARPGSAILSLLARDKVRVLLDVPETDFSVVAEGTPVELRVIALAKTMPGLISRRAPSADPGTRTVHAEIDIQDALGKIPVGTTAEITIEIGESKSATKIPLRSAAVRDDFATLFVVQAGVAHKLKLAVMGEAGGSLFVAPTLLPGTHVVSEGRALLKDGDPVLDKLESPEGGRP